ncbi:MAG: DNA primase [Ruminococcus sp.]|nr:DNA primase [Ruminococcus sp.]
MSTFENIKDVVSVKQVAEYYGINVNRSNMYRCPFHDDKTPSMKIYDKNYHCFGCGAHGDVIDLTANIFGTSQLEAARRINEDFCLGLDIDKPVSDREIQLICRRKQEAEEYSAWEKKAWFVIVSYYKLLCEWSEKYAPVSDKEIPDLKFIESIKNRDYIEYLCSAFINGDKTERLAMKEEVKRIEQRLYEYRRSFITCVAGGKGQDKRTVIL